ncbi:D-arabinitol 4-dehydrogenase [Cephaloticoccus primus]|uniref:D-arabinitol 4-dehydrogenase n=1 Tax=Cephaloticoccus primus TaxID=1548207 RepID=A0A139SQ26_9BACT|nr:D-arabinitol 4-dehydrogenase [Cephaloticoccus primus]KXU36632.1 D-arabinitol 4-dehydrogenase [Cephaloticoccus primus]
MTSTPNLSPYTQLHLGLGSFHRAHQAVYFQRLLEQSKAAQNGAPRDAAHDDASAHQAPPSQGTADWQLISANLRPDPSGAVDALAAQGGRYTLETVAPDGATQYQRITALREVIPYAPGLARVIERGSAADTRIISFTVTEAGYFIDGSGALNPQMGELAAAIEHARKTGGREAGDTLYGAICAILQARRAKGSGPVTLLNCDNLRHNGAKFRAALLEFMRLAGLDELRAWAEQNTSCPNAMVDRITPRPPPELRERVRQATGWADAAPIMAESFIQWVIEDDFIAGRPAWEQAGAELVTSVAPYEEAKIRILNASHSAIAWAGTLRGLTYIHEGTHVPEIRQIAYDYVTRDVIPALSQPGQPSPVDLPAYRDIVLDRFANPAIRDTNQRVAADGFSKIPGFIAPTLRERLAVGADISATAALPALFLLFLQRWQRGELPYTYQDQAMDEQQARRICTAADPVAALCADTSLWGDLSGNPHLEAALRHATAALTTSLQH